MSPVTIDMDMVVEVEGKMLNNNKALETPGIMEEVAVEEDLTERILLRDSKIIDR